MTTTTAKVYPEATTGPIIIEVSETDVERGYTTRECPDCQGTGVCIWHPEYPDTTLDCVRCSTRGEVVVSL